MLALGFEYSDIRDSESPRRTDVSDLCRECMLRRRECADAEAAASVPEDGAARLLLLIPLPGLLAGVGDTVRSPDADVVMDLRRLMDADSSEGSFLGEVVVVDDADFC